MPRFGPVSRRNLIGYLRQVGFAGPVPGTRHQVMVKGTIRLRIPNVHQPDISRPLLDRILKQGGISREEWESL